MHNLPEAECTWVNFCALLGARFGNIDPDTESRDQLRDLRQGSLPAAEYVHKVQYCFNGITDLPPPLPGDKIERFMSGWDPALRCLVVTAPFGS